MKTKKKRSNSFKKKRKNKIQGAPRWNKRGVLVVETKNNHMKTFKKYPVTINDLQFFVQYLGAEVEGNCKWHITSIDIPNIDLEIDTLWHTKEEAIQAIQEFIA